MATSQKYIDIPTNYLSFFKSRFLIERIYFALYSIRSNIDDRFVYDDSYRLQNVYLKESINTDYDLYSIKNLNLLSYLTSFLKTIIKNYIEYEEYVEYYDDNIPYCEDIVFIKMNLWLEEINEVIQHLEYIICSFDLNYQNMREKGEKFYMELSKYVHNPVRIEKIANIYNMEWYTYLDIIDL